MKRKIISARLFQDDHFKKSYWKYDFEKATRKAFYEFEKHFNVKFEITEVGDWDSGNASFTLPCNTERLAVKIITQLPNDLSPEELAGLILERFKNLSLADGVELNDKDAKNIYEALNSNESIACKLGYLIGYFESFLEECKVKYFSEKLLSLVDKRESELIIGFTTKFFSLRRINDVGLEAGGWGSSKNKIALIGFSSYPSHVVLHELGHVFGARHVKNKNSIMNAFPKLTYKFDRLSKKIISKTIREQWV